MLDSKPMMNSEIHESLSSEKPFLGIVDRADYLCAKSEGLDVLHVGCADYPLTLDRMNSEEFLHRRLTRASRSCLGVDLSAEAIEAMKGAGMDNVACGDACALSDQFEAEFDVIVAGEVLEHLPNPGEFMEQAARCLRPQGILVVTVPNAFNCLRLWGLLRGREMVHRDHCYYFSSKTLARLGSLSGFRLREIGYTDPLAYARHHTGITPIWRRMIGRFPVFGQSVVASFAIGSDAEMPHHIID